MILQIQPLSVSAYIAEVYDNDGGLIQQKQLRRFQEKDVRWLANVTQWDLKTANTNIQEWCEDEERNARAYEFDPPAELLESWTQNNAVDVPPPAPPPEPFILHMREITQLKKHGLTIRNDEPGYALKEALDIPKEWKEPIIEWVDTDRLCCLDVDYHHSAPPTFDEIYRIVSTIRPQPYAWHVSHGGGMKLYYVEHPGYTAIELASVAGMQWVEHHPHATFDLIKSTRHPSFFRSRDGKPPACTKEEIQYAYGSGDTSGIKRLINNEVDDTDVEEYLSSRGWSIGQLLPHTMCVIDPDSSPKENVYVGDRGIFCHRCNARGLGGRVAGFTSYASLIKGTDSRISSIVRNFVHVEHARVILQNLYPCIPVKVLDNVYRVMLKVQHGDDDPRVRMAMVAGKGFIRTRGQWVSSDGETPLADGVLPYVKSLPVTLVPREDGFGVNIPCLTAMLNSGDLSEYGYHDVSFIRGCKVYGQFLPYPHGEVVKVITRREFIKSTPTYVPPAARMPIERAWQMLEDEFPGINRTYLKLLIAAKGASEGRLAQCPFLMITGVSSAGKSTTVHIAAGICGDKADEPIFYPDVMRFRGSLMDAARTSGFVCVNEVFKMADRAKMSPTQALDPMLSLTEDSRSHVLYVGSVPFGRLPVFVLTDINCPHEITQDYQLARRFTFFRLDSSIEWTNTLVERNIRPHEFRLISTEHAAAADAILSDVIDEFFQTPTALSTIAYRLGIATANTAPVDSIKAEATAVNDYDDMAELGPESPEMFEREQLKETLARFFQAVCNAPQLDGSDAQRYNPKFGWKRIDRMSNSAILDIWSELCDGQQGSAWCRSRVCDAEDWRKLLKTEQPVVLDVSPYQQRILYVRFRSNDSSRRPRWVNGKAMTYPPRPRPKPEPEPKPELETETETEPE